MITFPANTFWYFGPLMGLREFLAWKRPTTNQNKVKQMKIAKQIWMPIMASVLSLGAASVQAAVTDITAITSGTWNAAGVHESGTSYQIGVNPKAPTMQDAYFEFNLNAVKGVTVTAAGILIPGSTDYNITAYWANPDNGNPTHTQFKVGTTGIGSPDTVSQILTGNNSTTIYLDACDANRNPDLGYDWVANGLHPGLVFDAFHYESTGQVGPILQDAVNAGGDYILWSHDRYNFEQNGTECTDNYIWGSTSYNTGIILEVTH